MYNLDGSELKKAILATFTYRETGFNEVVAFELGFTEAVGQVKKLLLPIVEAIEQKRNFDHLWDKETKEWN